MAKSLTDIVKGVKSSTVKPATLGKDPGVDYQPKAPGEQKYVASKTVEKHADRVGNGDDIYQATNIKPALSDTKKEPRHGRRNNKEAEKAEYPNSPNASMKEEAKCNHTPKGTTCPVHGVAECSSGYMIKEKIKKKIDEVLNKNTPMKTWIDDFQKSDNPKFAGKSPEKRRQMAIAARYAAKKEQVEENAYPVQPLLGSHNSDEAVDMVKTELRALANKAMHLVLAMPEGMHVEPWVQAKLAQAKEMVSSVHDYMIYGDHENEQTGPDTPITFPDMANDSAAGINV